MWKPAPRQAQTTISCAICKKPLMARRTCHTAYLRCEHCDKTYALQEYINCDRV